MNKLYQTTGTKIKMEDDWQINKSTLESTKYILQHEVKCDVSFKVGEEREIFKAHKLILHMRSPVFERMFNGLFCESEKDPVVPDVSPEAFRTLLRYCYYDYLDIGVDDALTVLYAATKYMLPILERAARKNLIQNLDSSRIWDVCKYSTDVGDKDLYTGCITYLKWNLSESNMLDVTRYAVTVGDKELRACCNKYLKDHLSGTNIWELYKYALHEKDEDVHQHCKMYFQRDVTPVREALQSKEFSNIPVEILSDVLHINDTIDEAGGVDKTPGISISEIELFRSCNQWAEAECLRQKIEPNGANKRKVLGQSLFLIRFPTMLLKDLMTVVYPLCILTQPEIVNLCQYIDKDPGSSCEVDFPSKERQFVIRPVGNTPGYKTVFIESDVRLMLSGLWTLGESSHNVSVTNETSQTSRSMVLKPKREKWVAGGSTYYLNYIQIRCYC